MSEANIEENDQQQNQVLTDAESHIKQACDMLQREAARLRHEQRAIDAMSKKLEHIHFTSTIQLNVGGHRFTTSLQTLTKDPNSMLAAMFSGKFEMKPTDDGAFFIDRDGTHFRFILNYLRSGELILPEGATFLKELEAEAKFYQIQGILDELVPKFPKNFEESVILTNEEHRNVLSGWLPPLEGKWQLLMRASQDGFAAQTFHSKCDNKGPTVTIVKRGNNIFGGFTETSWNSQNIYLYCSQSFLFSMVNPQGVAPSKMPLANNQRKAIFCYCSHGPTFGGGFDLHISNDADLNDSSYSNLGYSYQLPTGHQSTFFTGAKYFCVTDYEVFGTYQ
ncbi:uncharacterized protein LOC111324926 [Stylophora pistillata]|uniref:BTB/POZ domain-containing protein KCTD6 n=1 Tax=Stylophora pistillata TaxID=50429 RepID=A0A2B4SLU7_STYPI|nr:uncharacterized protein LOC111324926 [Stylophora pistillata]PFX29375.1 BTB/POZ domain-containing protein KCTD6 [Stylophora pistillata]